ncbi:hypothetical protein V6N13_028455 [Hibiscus sabdariffa]
MMFMDHGCKWLLGKKKGESTNSGFNGSNDSRFGVLSEGENDVINVSQVEDPKRLEKDDERRYLAKWKAVDKGEIKVRVKIVEQQNWSTQGDLHVKSDVVSKATSRVNYGAVEDY